jgi:hypothetical protein
MDHDDDASDMIFTPPPSSRSGSRNRRAIQTPQETLRQFWEQFNSKFPGRIYTVLPDNPYARRKAARIPNGVIQGQNAGKSYEEARKECQRAVERIIKECERLNQKYTDPHFDIEVDLKSGRRDCLDGLDAVNMEMRPRGVKRVTVSTNTHASTQRNVVRLMKRTFRKFSRNRSSSLMDQLLQTCARAATGIVGSWLPSVQWATSMV